MKRRLFAVIAPFLAAGVLVTAAPAAAQRLDLAISPQTISFPLSDPDTVPVVSSVSAQLTYRVRQNNNQPWTLTVLAMGDLTSGLSTVDIGSVSWIATPLSRNVDLLTRDFVPRRSFNFGINGQLAQNTTFNVSIAADRMPLLFGVGSPWTTRSVFRVTRAFSTGAAPARSTVSTTSPLWRVRAAAENSTVATAA